MKIKTLINHDNYYAIGMSPYINEIVRPLFPLGITYFNHLRIFNDLSRISLGTHADWLQHFNTQKLYLVGCYSGNPTRFDMNQVILWRAHSDNRVVIEASSNFNIDNGVTLTKTTRHYKDFYTFASTRDNTTINEFMLSNRDLLERFIAFYHEKAEAIITKCQPDTPEYMAIADCIINQQSTINQEILNAVNRAIKPDKMRLHHRGNIYTISPIEYNCATLLARGKTAKEIATIQGIQPSTFYRHLENLRTKLGLTATRELIQVTKHNFLG